MERSAAMDEATHPRAESVGVKEGRSEEIACLNCGTRLLGPHCHACGQEAHVHRTIAAWWHDFLHGVLHLEGSVLRTLPKLALHPGELTRRYVMGERAKFVSPLALFLFTVFLMFAVFSVAGGSVQSAAEVSAELPADIEAREQALVAAEEQRQVLVSRDQDTAQLDSRIAELRQEIAAEERLLQTVDGMEQDPLTVRTGWSVFDDYIAEAAENDFSLLLYKLQANGYKFSWALIPISAAFVWLLFLHRRRYRQDFNGYDHFVFVTYSISFMSLLSIAFVVLGAIGLRPDLVSLAFLIIPPLHLYRQLRGAYGLSRGSALWRTFFLLIFALAALILFLLLLLIIGATS